MGNLLFGVTPTDPLTFASILVLLVGVALAAGFIPTRKAMKATQIHLSPVISHLSFAGKS
jgi:hypothetical protein